MQVPGVTPESVGLLTVVVHAAKKEEQYIQLQTPDHFKTMLMVIAMMICVAQVHPKVSECDWDAGIVLAVAHASSVFLGEIFVPFCTAAFCFHPETMNVWWNMKSA